MGSPPRGTCYTPGFCFIVASSKVFMRSSRAESFRGRELNLFSTNICLPAGAVGCGLVPFKHHLNIRVGSKEVVKGAQDVDWPLVRYSCNHIGVGLYPGEYYRPVHTGAVCAQNIGVKPVADHHWFLGFNRCGRCCKNCCLRLTCHLWSTSRSGRYSSDESPVSGCLAAFFGDGFIGISRHP